MIDKPVRTTKDVAKILGISPVGVRMLVYRGRLPARKLGGRLVFLRDELEAHLKKLPPVVQRK